jgi:hypothetical protein
MDIKSFTTLGPECRFAECRGAFESVVLLNVVAPLSNEEEIKKVQF